MSLWARLRRHVNIKYQYRIVIDHHFLFQSIPWHQGANLLYALTKVNTNTWTSMLLIGFVKCGNHIRSLLKKYFAILEIYHISNDSEVVRYTVVVGLTPGTFATVDT